MHSRRSIWSSAVSPACDRSANSSCDGVGRRNSMRTLGRRMHAKARCEFSISSRPVQRLDAMNLGEVVSLTPDEARYFQCRDVRGRIVDGLYSAPVGCAASPIAVGSRIVTSFKRDVFLQSETSSRNSRADRRVADEDIGATDACAGETAARRGWALQPP